MDVFWLQEHAIRLDRHCLGLPATGLEDLMGACPNGGMQLLLTWPLALESCGLSV